MAPGTTAATRLKVNDVEAYFARVPKEARATLEKMRQTIKATVPKAVEVIWYQIPTFKLADKPLVSIAAFKNHCSLFPMSYAVLRSYEEELKPYHTSKGTLRFSLDQPIPAALVKKVVKARIQEIEARKKR
ncbi:MAG TPA: DUF1801 domain-containing protein [Pyrinomonadaceae bacterium]|nr:DUF1801 domain-containing protein [Pyrinomonadaceae bacterium]